MKKITTIVLGAFLILSGLIGILPGLGGLGLVILILQVAAGILILIFTPGISNRIGWILAAVFLLVDGLAGLIGFSFAGMDIILAILALIAGIVSLIRMPKIKRKLGYLLFFVWLILVGLIRLMGLGSLDVVVPIIALAAGILLILGL